MKNILSPSRYKLYYKDLDKCHSVEQAQLLISHSKYPLQR